MVILKNVTSKNIKNYILDPSNDLDELIDFYDYNSKFCIEGIFNALFILLKHYEQNKSRVNYLVTIVEELIEVKNIDEVKYFLGPIKDINNKINNIFSVKEKVSIRDIRIRLESMQNKINNSIIMDSKNSKTNCIEYLVFQGKNITVLENIINNQSYSDILSSVNKRLSNSLYESSTILKT